MIALAGSVLVMRKWFCYLSLALGAEGKYAFSRNWQCLSSQHAIPPQGAFENGARAAESAGIVYAVNWRNAEGVAGFGDRTPLAALSLLAEQPSAKYERDST